MSAVHFNDVLIALNLVFSLLPSPFTAEMIASAMPAAIKAVFDRGGAGFVDEKLLGHFHVSRTPMTRTINVVGLATGVPVGRRTLATG